MGRCGTLVLGEIWNTEHQSWVILGPPEHEVTNAVRNGTSDTFLPNEQHKMLTGSDRQHFAAAPVSVVERRNFERER